MGTRLHWSGTMGAWFVSPWLGYRLLDGGAIHYPMSGYWSNFIGVVEIFDKAMRRCRGHYSRALVCKGGSRLDTPFSYVLELGTQIQRNPKDFSMGLQCFLFPITIVTQLITLIKQLKWCAEKKIFVVKKVIIYRKKPSIGGHLTHFEQRNGSCAWWKDTLTMIKLLGTLALDNKIKTVKQWIAVHLLATSRCTHIHDEMFYRHHETHDIR